MFKDNTLKTADLLLLSLNLLAVLSSSGESQPGILFLTLIAFFSKLDQACLQVARLLLQNANQFFLLFWLSRNDMVLK